MRAGFEDESEKSTALADPSHPSLKPTVQDDAQKKDERLSELKGNKREPRRICMRAGFEDETEDLTVQARPGR